MDIQIIVIFRISIKAFGKLDFGVLFSVFYPNSVIIFSRFSLVLAHRVGIQFFYSTTYKIDKASIMSICDCKPINELPISCIEKHFPLPYEDSTILVETIKFTSHKNKNYQFYFSTVRYHLLPRTQQTLSSP